MAPLNGEPAGLEGAEVTSQPATLEHVEAARVILDALLTASVTAEKMRTAFAVNSGHFAAEVHTILEGSLDLSAKASTRLIRVSRSIFEAGGFTVASDGTFKVETPTLARLPVIAEALQKSLNTIEGSIKEAAEKLQSPVDEPANRLKRPLENGEERQDHATFSSLHLQQIIQAAVQGAVGAGEQATSGKAPDALSFWQNVDRSLSQRDHFEDDGEVRMVDVRATVKRNRKLDVHAWRQGNLEHIMTLVEPHQSQFVQLCMVLERFIGIGHSFENVYNFSQEAAEEDRKRPEDLFSPHLLAARFLTSKYAQNQPKAKGSSAVSPLAPCPFFNDGGCKYTVPGACRKGSHECTRCGVTGVGATCAGCPALPPRGGNAGRGGRGGRG